MPTKFDPLPARAWLVVGLLWLVACLNYLDRLILITMRSSIKETIPMSDAQFGLLTTVFLVTYGLLSPLGGFVADKINRSRVIIFSLFAWSAATWLTAHATSLGELLCYRSLMGISEACYFPAAAALLMDYHRQNTRSLANGIHLSGVMVGSGLGGLGGWIAEKVDWMFVFQLFGIGGILYAGVLLVLLRDRPATVVPERPVEMLKPSVHLGEAISSLFTSPGYLIALIFWGLLAIASWAFIGWLPSYLTEQFHMSQGRAGLTALGYIYSTSILGMVIGGAWADRWSRSQPRARIWVGAIGVLIAAPAIMLAANTTSLVLLAIGLMTYGFARPFPDANMAPILCQIVDARYMATGYGILNALATLIGGVTIYAGGALRDAHISITTVFNFGAFGLLVCAVLLWFVKPRFSEPLPSS
jgi:predicted MFS family arabinose efflux permease